MSNAKAGEPTSRLQTILILLCVSVPSFMINLDSNIVAVSLSSIARSFRADFADIEWVISAYTLTFASLLLPAGAIADRYGRKRALQIGLVTFTFASFVCGAAPSVAILNGARALQGVGAALLSSSALAMLAHEFHGAARARAFAFWGSVVGVGMTLGPVAGGFITQHFGWEWSFYINIPVGVVMIPLVARVVTDSRDPKAGRLDIPGFLTFSSSLFLTTLALISANREGWGSRVILGELAAALVLFAVFVAAELKQTRPMLDLRFFRNPTYIGASIASVAYAASLLTMLTYLPMYFQSGLGFDAQTAGLLMLPLAIPLFVVPRIAVAHLAHRFSGRALLTAGLAFVGAGVLWMAFVALRFDYGAVVGGMVIAGIGAGILNGEIAKVGMTVIPPERAGMAGGMAATQRFSGVVIGFAALGALLYERISATVAAYPDTPIADRTVFAREIAAGHMPAASQHALYDIALRSFGAAYQAIFLAAAGLAALAALTSWLLIRRNDTAPVQKVTRVVSQPQPAE
ncbi:N/A [soil metagenome]